MYAPVLIGCSWVLLLGLLLVVSYVFRNKAELFKAIVTLCVWMTPPFFPRSEKRALSLGLFAVVLGLSGVLLVVYGMKTGIKIGPGTP